MNSLPPSFNSAIFNSLAFNTGGYLTKSQADLLYVPYSSIVYINYLYGVTPGIATASKALIFDSSINISGINNITGITGYIGISNITASTSSTTGSLLLSGGIGISNTTDASSSSNGGSFTTAGGMAIAKSLYVGTNITATNLSGTLQTAAQPNVTSIGTLTGLTVNGTSYIRTTDANTASVIYPLNVEHLLSSGSPSNNNFGIGLLLNGPNSSNSTISYGRIYSICQSNTSGVHQGSMTLSSVFAGSFVDVMTISSLTSSTNNLVAINGATSVLSVYNISGTTGTWSDSIFITKAAGPKLTITSSTATSLSQIFLITDNQTWEVGARGSTNAQYPTNFYIYNGGFNMVMTPAGITTFLNSSVSTTSTSNAFQISGGLYTAKAILNNSYYNCNTNNTPSSHSVSTQAICLNDQAIYFRNQNSGDTNHGLMYSGNGNSSWNSSNGFGNSSSFKVDGPVLYGNAGVMIGNLNSAATETICATFVGTTSSLQGIVNINTPTVKPAQVNIQSNGTQLSLNNGTNNYVYFNTYGDGRLSINCTSTTATPNTLSYWFDCTYSTVPRFSLSGNSPPTSVGTNFRLYLGSDAADIQICLYNANNLSNSYGFGANNSCIQYISGGSNGHRFYYNSTSGVGAPTALGTNIFNIQGNGNIVSKLNMFSNAGVHAFGYDTTDLSSYGPGVHMHYAASQGSVFAYDYSTAAYKDIGFNNNNLYIKSSNGFVGIGTTSPSCPLHVSGTGAQTTASAFGWLSGSGTGTATGFTGRNFSIRCSSGIMCDSGEIDVLSDERYKENINIINDDMVNTFINKIKPITYNYKNSKTTYHGYSAQNLMKNNFNILVGSMPSDEPIDEQELINDDTNEKIIIPKDSRLVVNVLSTIPLLHRALQMQNDIIKDLQDQIKLIKLKTKFQI